MLFFLLVLFTLGTHVAGLFHGFWGSKGEPFIEKPCVSQPCHTSHQKNLCEITMLGGALKKITRHSGPLLSKTRFLEENPQRPVF